MTKLSGKRYGEGNMAFPSSCVSLKKLGHGTELVGRGGGAYADLVFILYCSTVKVRPVNIMILHCMKSHGLALKSSVISSRHSGIGRLIAFVQYCFFKETFVDH